jgi:hypothetical protein
MLGYAGFSLVYLTDKSKHSNIFSAAGDERIKRSQNIREKVFFTIKILGAVNIHILLRQ